MHVVLLTFAALCLAANVRAAALPAAEWVTNARTADPPQFSEKHVVSVNDACDVVIKKGDVSTTPDSGGAVVQSIDLVAGMGVLLDVCATGTTTTQTLKAPDLFNGSAVWKVESTAGYAEGELLVECKANPGKCCSIYFVPVATGDFVGDIETCTSKTVAVNVTAGTSTDTLAAPDPLVDGTLSDSDPIDLEISLVYSPECGLGAPSTEGADGVYEGTGESQSPSPSPSEGDDGVYEGTGESQMSPPSASPSPSEGADGVYEGTGESQGSPPISAEEGADGVVEGTGEGASPPPGTNTPSPPPSSEGSEGGGSPSEGSRRRLRADGASENDASASAYPGTKWFWSHGHTVNENSLINPDAQQPSEGGEAEGTRRLLGVRRGPSRTLLDASTGVPMYDASVTPVEMVVGVLYKIEVNMVRAPLASYFSAVDFFKSSLLKHVEDAGAVIEFGRLSDVELYPGANFFSIYVQPMKAGTYTFTSNADSADGIVGNIKVVAAVSDLSNSTAFATQDVSTSACNSTTNSTSSPSSQTQGSASSTSESAKTVLAGICAAVVGMSLLLGLL